MKRYQVLWIDDRWDDQEEFIDSAFLENIDIDPFKTSKEGMDAFENKLDYYDAVILDALVFNETEDEHARLTGLLSSIKKINALADCLTSAKSELLEVKI